MLRPTYSLLRPNACIWVAMSGRYWLISRSCNGYLTHIRLHLNQITLLPNSSEQIVNSTEFKLWVLNIEIYMFTLGWKLFSPYIKSNIPVTIFRKLVNRCIFLWINPKPLQMIPQLYMGMIDINLYFSSHTQKTKWFTSCKHQTYI